MLSAALASRVERGAGQSVIAAQLSVLLPLISTQQLGSREMVFEVHSTKCALSLADLRHQRLQSLMGNCPCRKLRVQGAFAFDELLTGRQRRCDDLRRTSYVPRTK